MCVRADPWSACFIRSCVEGFHTISYGGPSSEICVRAWVKFQFYFLKGSPGYEQFTPAPSICHFRRPLLQKTREMIGCVLMYLVGTNMFYYLVHQHMMLRSRRFNTQSFFNKVRNFENVGQRARMQSNISHLRLVMRYQARPVKWMVHCALFRNTVSACVPGILPARANRDRYCMHQYN